MNLRSQRGINVITLSVAIIILVLITSVLVYNSKDSVKIRNLKDLYNDIETLDNKISAYYLEHGDLPKLDTPYTNTAFLANANSEEVNPNDSGNYYVIDLSELQGVTLNYGKDYDTVTPPSGVVPNVNDYTDLYIVNEASHTVYYPKGINLQGINYHTQGQEWRNVALYTIPIETAEQFAKIGTNETVTIGGVDYRFGRDQVYVLKNDIDLSSICHKVDGTTENDKSWTPLCGTESTAFAGKLYGNGHEVRGLYINKTTAYQGLFGWNNGIIQGVTVEGSVASTNSVIAAITGRNSKDGKIIKCTSKVLTVGYSQVGGIVGKNFGKIYECYNFRTIEGTVENSLGGAVGGITGDNAENGIIEKSYNEGTIIAKSNCVGGIAGGSHGIINLCINNGKITSMDNHGIGGITGYTNNVNAKITNCYNIGEITNSRATGGIVGNLDKGQVVNCYSIGTIAGTGSVRSVIGAKSATNTVVRNLFYLDTLPTNDPNATPKSMADMKLQSFVNQLNAGQEDLPWAMDNYGINDGYPVLKWQNEEFE